MSEVTRILSAIEQGDPSAAGQLLPLVYDELRKLAAQKLAQERPGQTLQATALVHEAYLRLVGNRDEPRWDSSRHFFAAAAEAMRRILVESARRKGRAKRGGGRKRVDLDDADLLSLAAPDEVLLIDEAIDKLAREERARAVNGLRALVLRARLAALRAVRPLTFRTRQKNPNGAGQSPAQWRMEKRRESQRVPHEHKPQPSARDFRRRRQTDPGSVGRLLDGGVR
jgi:RNA polymerase sigma factor (TIGR02999 family)